MTDMTREQIRVSLESMSRRIDANPISSESVWIIEWRNALIACESMLTAAEARIVELEGKVESLRKQIIKDAGAYIP